MAGRRVSFGVLVALLEPAALAAPQSTAGQVRSGQLLLLISGLITTATIFPLHPSPAAVIALVLVSAALLAVVGLSALLPWSRLPSRATLLFPVSVLAGLIGIAAADHTTAIAYTGLIVFCFVYTGLTQPPGTSAGLAPVAAACWLEVEGSWTAVLAVRLVIAVSIWIVVGELLGRNVQRQTQLTYTLRGNADTDPLTGLLNRRGLDLRLTAAAGGDCLVLCDLDHFKSINDRLGHQEGDRVLADFGALLKTSLRGQDLAGRYGGEEFLILLVAATPTEAFVVLDRMRDRWALQHSAVTFSTGVAAVHAAEPLTTTLAAADAGLYKAKAAGRNRDYIADSVRGADDRRLELSAQPANLAWSESGAVLPQGEPGSV